MRGIKQMMYSGEPIDISGSDYGSRVCRVVGLEGADAAVVVGKNREEVVKLLTRRVPELPSHVRDTFAYIDECERTGVEVTKEEGEKFCDKLALGRIPESLRRILAIFSEGGQLSAQGVHYEEDGTMHVNGECASYARNLEEQAEALEALVKRLTTPPKERPNPVEELARSLGLDLKRGASRARLCHLNRI